MIMDFRHRDGYNPFWICLILFDFPLFFFWLAVITFTVDSILYRWMNTHSHTWIHWVPNISGKVFSVRCSIQEKWLNWTTLICLRKNENGKSEKHMLRMMAHERWTKNVFRHSIPSGNIENFLFISVNFSGTERKTTPETSNEKERAK